VVLANGSMSSMQSGEGDIRRAMVDGDVVDCMIALPGQLFYSTQIPACLWFLTRDKSASPRPLGEGPGVRVRDRRGEVLFIDARKLSHMVDRTRCEFSDEDIARIASTYHAWRGEESAGEYQDVPGFCKAATLEEIKVHNYILTPGRYVGAADIEEDDVPFTERFAELNARLGSQFGESAKLVETIRKKLAGVIL
jgi:type I restriction enzyme M protein